MAGTPDAAVAQKELQALTLVERVQIGSAIGTALLAITYVSGYLTATVYLGTYSISADTSEIFRAKYIYIGFDYWLFVAILGMFVYVAGLLVDLSKLLVPPQEQTSVEEVVRQELVKRRLNPEVFIARTRLLRWGLAGSLITVVFSFEIMFMQPMEFRGYLALQALFLLFLSLYQTTFYREYARTSYGWGVIWGRLPVRWIRWVYSLVFDLICTTIMVCKALRIHVARGGFLAIYVRAEKFEKSVAFAWLAWAVTGLTFLVALFLTLSGEDLKRGDETIRWERWRPRNMLVRIGLAFVVFPFVIPIYLILALINSLHKSKAPSLDEWAAIEGLIGLLLNKGVFTLVVTLYCCMAFDLWEGHAFLIWTPNQTAILSAYCTLGVALVILTNIVKLSWMHQERERHLGINRRAIFSLQSGDRPVPEVLTAEWRILSRLAIPVTVLYLVSVLGFAHLIYPFIPVDKAGGNYSVPEAGPVYVAINHGNTVCSSTELAETITPTSGYYIIEETSNWLYLAPQSSAHGPNCWKWGVFCEDAQKDLQDAKQRANKRSDEGALGKGQYPEGTPQQDSRDSLLSLVRFRPDVYQVDRQCVVAVASKPWGNNSKNAPTINP